MRFRSTKQSLTLALVCVAYPACAMSAGLEGYSISEDANGNVVLVNQSGLSVTLVSVESLKIGGITYIPASGGAINSGDGGLSNAFYSTSQNTIHSYGSTVWYAQNLLSSSDNNIGLSGTSALTYYGSGSQETLNLNVDRTQVTGNWTIDLGAGNDSINSAKLKNGDSIDMGAGDDTLSMMINGSYGTPTIAAANFALLDGGTGTDTISWEEAVSADGQTLTLSSGGAVNFENLRGSSFAETLTGDANANVLEGKGGVDTLYGLAGDDELYADSSSDVGMPVGSCSQGSTADVLYGGAGDDTLCGSGGDNTLDGGTGKDAITSGGGNDTIVIRAGDGSTLLSEANIITDFEDTADLIGLDGINFNDLTITQGTGDYANDTIVSYGVEHLFIIQNVSLSNITDVDFTPI